WCSTTDRKRRARPVRCLRPLFGNSSSTLWVPGKLRMKSATVKARPGRKIRLSKIDPDDMAGLTKEEACARFSELCDEIGALQEKLFAEHERSLLILFQAMDTGGKDGAVK